MSDQNIWVSSIAAWRPGLRVAKRSSAAPDHLPLTRVDLRIGSRYTRRQIHEALGGALQEFLPHVGNRVVCGCFKLADNPRAPKYVLPAFGPKIEHWARVFSEQRSAVPIFLKRSDSNWEYVGDYRAVRLITDPREVAEHRREARRENIPFVLELERTASGTGGAALVPGG